MNCKSIIEKHLKDNGFDGLVHVDTECGCYMGDAGLAICGCYYDECEPAYKHEDENGDWTMKLYSEADH